MKQKVTIVNFDLWGYGTEISNALEKNFNCEATCLNTIGVSYKYKSKKERILNFFSKNLLKKNLKRSFRDAEMISKFFNHLQNQDIILVINPGEYSDLVLKILRSKTAHLIGYNYDSVKRSHITNYHYKLFDKLFSFDKIDCANDKRLNHVSNFIHTSKKELKTEGFQYKCFFIMSYDPYRYKILNRLANILTDKNFNFIFQVLGVPTTDTNTNIQYISKHLSIDIVSEYLSKAEIFLDILRKKKDKQSGLSFRIFEAMTFQRKLITTNVSVKDYDFYNPQNIFVIEDVDNFEIPDSFFNGKYIPIPDKIYKKYTLTSWIETVFDLKPSSI